jgi:transposase
LLLIGQCPKPKRILHLLTGIKGIADASAIIALMGELLLLPPDLSHRQGVTMLDLIPKPSSRAKAPTKKRA